MPDISLKINGEMFTGHSGSTVLDVCRENDIYIPTLCHFPGISEAGACRLCIVEIDGERRPVPSCNYTAREGLVVRTNTAQIEKSRRQILELIFAERNHYCMFCEKSGDCELQKLAYRYAMDNNRYQGLYPRLPVDTLSKYIVIDHNRCVLCGRCVRTCNEVAGNRTLDFGGRGGNTLITADLNQELRESSCTLCGACVQACPTGAIFDKTSMYKGRSDQCTKTETLCPGCSIGCEINVFVKDNHIIKIESPDPRLPKGQLCRAGRFELAGESRTRIESPMIRGNDGNLKQCSIEEAIRAAADGFETSGQQSAGLISPVLCSGTMERFLRLITGVLKSSLIDTLDGNDFRAVSAAIKEVYQNIPEPKPDTDIADILHADCILVNGSDIDLTHGVAGSLVRRAVNEKQARLIVIDAEKNYFSQWTDLRLEPNAGSESILVNGLVYLVSKRGKITNSGEVSEVTGVPEELIEEAASVLGNARHAALINGCSQNKELTAGFFRLAALTSCDRTQSRLFLFPKSINSPGAWKLGLPMTDIRSRVPAALYLLLGDDSIEEPGLNWIKGIEFLTVQASFRSEVTEIADVVLPSRTWAERTGKYETGDGREIKIKSLLDTTLLTDDEILDRIIKCLSDRKEAEN
jgi:formate dehydrogenase major subunit